MWVDKGGTKKCHDIFQHVLNALWYYDRCVSWHTIVNITASQVALWGITLALTIT